MIQLAVYHYFNEEIKKKVNSEFYIKGQQVSFEKYKEFVDSLDEEYQRNMGQTIQSPQDNSSAEPVDYEDDDQPDEENQCMCVDCQSQRTIEDSLNFVFGTNASIDEKIQSIVDMGFLMREIGFEEAEMQIDDQDKSDNITNYNINLHVGENGSSKENLKNLISSVMSEIRKNEKQSEKGKDKKTKNNTVKKKGKE